MKKLIAVLIIGSMVIPGLAFAQTTSQSSQTILTNLLQQLLSLYEQELTQLESQLSALQAQQNQLQSEVNTQSSTSLGMVSPNLVTTTTTSTTTNSTSSNLLSQIASTTPQVIQTTTITNYGQENNSNSSGITATAVPTAKPLIVEKDSSVGNITVVAGQRTSTIVAQFTVYNPNDFQVFYAPYEIQYEDTGIWNMQLHINGQNEYFAQFPNPRKGQFQSGDFSTFSLPSRVKTSVSILPHETSTIQFKAYHAGNAPTGTFSPAINLCQLLFSMVGTGKEYSSVDNNGNVLSETNCVSGQTVIVE